jgi:hypothetical protein
MTGTPFRRWLTPAAPAALAVVRLSAEVSVLQRLSDRSLPAVGAALVTWVRDCAGTPVDEAVLVRSQVETLDLMVHGGPGVRTALDACLDGHGFTGMAAGHGQSGQDMEGSAWTMLAQAASPSAVRWLLSHPGQAPGFNPDYLMRAPLVLITGPANAGKSTLLNAWCGHRRAVVSAVAGTTRDLVGAETLIEGWRIRLLDSAGLRTSTDVLEHAGQALAITARTWVDAVVVLSLDAEHLNQAHSHQPGDLLVHGMCDQRETLPAGLLWSAHGLPGRTRAQLLDVLGSAVLDQLGLPGRREADGG